MSLDTLTRINLDDFFDSLGIPHLRRSGLQWLFWLPARQFARRVLEFDDRVGQQGLSAGSEWLLNRMAGGVAVVGQDNVPVSGPVLILSNHPGMADTIALFASLPMRPDLRVIAFDRPFLQALPNVSRQMIYVPSERPDRMGVVRETLQHLRQGGAALTFPAGEIEPDPAVMGPVAAVESLARWSDSVALFARLAPQTRIVPAIVSHVVSPAAQTNPLTRLRPTPKDRDKMAAALQIMIPAYQQLTARVAFGPPLLASDLVTVHQDAAALTRAITAQARRLIEAP